MLRPLARARAVLAVAGTHRSPAPQPSAPVEPPAPRVDASDLFAKFECNRCHEVPGLAAAPPNRHCVTCHAQIHAGTFAADPALGATWRERLTSILGVPSLLHAERFRRAWVAEFLLEPHDLRPGLVAQMPRLAITRAEAERIAAHLVPVDAASDLSDAAEGDIARGEQLYRSLTCGRCHRFSGTGVELADARDLAAFIARALLADPPPRAPASRLAVLSRAVTRDEVETTVF
jgi:hypothetical protein